MPPPAGPPRARARRVAGGRPACTCPRATSLSCAPISMVGGRAQAAGHCGRVAPGARCHHMRRRRGQERGRFRWQAALGLPHPTAESRLGPDVVTCGAAVGTCKDGHHWQAALEPLHPHCRVAPSVGHQRLQRCREHARGARPGGWLAAGRHARARGQRPCPAPRYR
eukprot:15468656-Alexandrium_andersonii.AAC.1